MPWSRRIADRTGDHVGAAASGFPAQALPRERLCRHGPGPLSELELLALIVGSGSRGAGALDVAASVLSLTKGSLSNLAKLDAAQLEDVPGVGPVVAGRLIAAVELGRRVARAPRPRTEPVAGPGDVYRLLAPTLGDLDHEEFHVVLLNAQNIPITHKLVTRGILDASLIHPREVFRAQLRPLMVMSGLCASLLRGQPPNW